MKKIDSKDDTIVAIATPYSTSSIGVIRLSGSQVQKIIHKIWKPLKKSSNLRPKELTLGWVYEKNILIDQAMVVYMPSPNSFTAEDVVEIQTHGSPVVLDKCIQLCIKNGARAASPGEFSKRAFLNGKINLSQAESIAQIISAQSLKAAQLATNQLSNPQSQSIKKLKQTYLSLCAQAVADLDFSEEDNSSISDQTIIKRLSATKKLISKTIVSARAGNLYQKGFSVALIGLPNAGKSTLLNNLLGYDRAIVTPIAGTTRDTISETVVINSIPFNFIDTAGLNTNPDTVEKIGISKTHQAIKTVDHILVLVAPNTLSQTKNYLKENNLNQLQTSKNMTIINTKSDTLKKPLPNSISTKTNQGIPHLKELLCNTAIKSIDFGEAILLSQRQLDLLQQLKKLVQTQLDLIIKHTPQDILLVEYQTSLSIINQLSGEDTTQSIIDEVFSNFCIGK